MPGEKGDSRLMEGRAVVRDALVVPDVPGVGKVNEPYAAYSGPDGTRHVYRDISRVSTLRRSQG